MGGWMKKLNLVLLLSLFSASAHGATNKYVSTQEILLGHITTPANPAAGRSKVYAKSDNLLYILTSAGSESRVGSGDFVGPASSTDEAVCRFDGTTGKLAQNSAATINDTGKGTFVGLLDSTLTASRAMVTDGSKNLTSATTTATEIGYVNGVTSAIQTQIDGKQATDADLTALAGLASTGLVARTAANTYSERTLTGTANQITVTNGDGVAGNPTVSIPSNPVLPGTGHSVNGISYLTGTDDPTATATSAAAGSLYTNTTTGTIYRKTDAGSSTNWSIIGTSAAITDWIAYTPTFTGFGTVTVQDFKYRQVGGSVEIEGRWTPGTTTATEARISLPSFCTSASDYVTLENVGFGVIEINGRSLSILIEPSVTYVTFGGVESSINGLTKRNGNDLGASGNKASIKASIRCTGLASVVNTATTPVITAYTSYTPTFTGFGTVTCSNCMRYRQVGGVVEIDGVFTVGTTTATEARMTLPSVCSTSASDYGIVEIADGNMTVSTNGAQSFVPLIEANKSYITFGLQYASAAGLTKALGSTVLGTGTTASLHAKVRCAGMPGVIPAANLVGLTTNNGSSAIRIEGANFASQSGGACAVTEVGGSDWINGNATSGATGDCTITLNAGIFSSAPVCVCSQVGSNSKICSINATPTTSTIQTYTITDGGAASNSAVAIQCMGPR